MMYVSASEYYFWIGLKTAVFDLGEEHYLGLKVISPVQEKCIESFQDGFIIGLNMSIEEYKEIENEKLY